MYKKKKTPTGFACNTEPGSHKKKKTQLKCYVKKCANLRPEHAPNCTGMRHFVHPPGAVENDIS
jgi:hypothetical protein